MIKYSDNRRNHVIMPGREKELDQFLNGTFKGVSHKLKNSYSSNSEDAITWSCFDVISQLSDSKKITALDEIMEHSFSGKDMNCPPFSFKNEDNIEVEVGKVYKGLSIKEQTELDASIETSRKVIFIEAKLYSSISLKDKSKPYDQIAKKIRVGLDYASEEQKEFYFIFLDIAPREKLYAFASEQKSMKNAMKLPTRKWKSVWWFNRYKKGWGGSLKPLEEILVGIPTSQGTKSISNNMGWLTWSDLFKITMRGMI